MPRRSANTRWRVTVRIAPGPYYNRRLLAGIAQFGGARDRWQFVGDPAHADQSPEGLDGVRLDGLLIYEASEPRIERYRRLGVPLVNTTAQPLAARCARLQTDGRAIGRLAAEYLFTLGLRRLVGLGRKHHAIDSDRLRHFADNAHAADAEVCPPLFVSSTQGWTADNFAPLVRRIAAHDRPIGVFCGSDKLASALIHALSVADLHVPQRVAVLGCGNDELTCTFSETSISSIDPDAIAVGYRAAELLDRMMSGKVTGTPVVTVPPRGLVERDSTRMIAVDDPYLAEAIRLVRQNACRGIQIDRVHAQVPMSRRSLERGFMRALGRTPHQELRRVQLEQVRRMLIDTDHSVDQIARQVGLRDGRYLSQVVRKAWGQTPTQFRQQNRRPDITEVDP